MTVAHTSTTSTDIPRVTVGPRPAFPAQAPAVQHLSHDLPHIPTARTAAGSYTREQLDAAIVQAEQDEPRPYDTVVLGYGIPAHLTAFGSAA